MSVLNRDQLLAGLRLAVEDVPVPELGNGAVIRVREMTIAAREAWNRHAFEPLENGARTMKAKEEGFRARLIIACAVDEAGAPLFSYEDLPAVAGLPGNVGDRLVAAAIRLNGLDQDEETLVKN